MSMNANPMTSVFHIQGDQNPSRDVDSQLGQLRRQTRQAHDTFSQLAYSTTAPFTINLYHSYDCHNWFVSLETDTIVFIAMRFSQYIHHM